MKIALYVRSWPPGYRPPGAPPLPNGVVTYTWAIAPELRRLGHEVFIFAWEKSPEWQDPYTVDVRSFAPRSTLWDRVRWKLDPDGMRQDWVSMALMSAVQDAVARHGIEVMEIEESFGMSCALSRAELLPVAVRLHGPIFLNGQFDQDLQASRVSRNRIRREGEAIAAATGVTAPSSSVLSLTATHYGHDYSVSKVIPNATAPVDEGGAWNISSADRHSILFVGRFDRHKGGDVVLRAFAKLAASDRNVRLTFVGAEVGVSTPSGVRQSLAEFLAAPAFDGLRDRITCTGPLSLQAVQDLRSKAFLTIVASRYETFCLALTEAMAAGCPIVATAAGAIPEIIQHERNGLLAASEDADAIAAGCRRLLDDPGLAARLGRQARQDCADRYAPAKVAGEMAEFLARVIHAWRSSRTAR